MKYLASSLALASAALARTITVYNACPFTIWYVCVLPLCGIDDEGATAGPQYVLTYCSISDRVFTRHRCSRALAHCPPIPPGKHLTYSVLALNVVQLGGWRIYCSHFSGVYNITLSRII